MINLKPLLYAKGFYFLYYAANASLLPFLSIYYQSLGLSGSQIGLLLSISPFIMLVSSPIWGAAADITNRHKTSLLFAMGGALIMAGLLSQLRQFAFIVLIALFFSFFSAPIIPLIDNSVMALLGDRRDLYGRQRMWGAVGWGISAPLIGYLADHYGLRWVFVGYMIWLGLGCFVILGLPVEPVRLRVSFLKGLRQLVAKREWVFFLLTVFVSGVNMSIITNYLFLYFADMGINRSTMGLALTLATVSEVPVLFLVNRLIKYLGSQGVLFLSLAASIIRAFGYAFAPSSGFALGLQILHGLTFSAMWAAGVSYSNSIAPPGLGATAQSVFFSVVFGLSGITGGLVGGLLYETFGGTRMFLWSGSGVLAATVIFLALLKFTGKRKNLDFA